MKKKCKRGSTNKEIMLNKEKRKADHQYIQPTV